MSEDKGLSILIPVYNQDVRELINALVLQGQSINLPFEIRCYDDFSKPSIRSINQAIKKYSHVAYQELDKNLGRSRIRNKMAEEAIYDSLLFLDGDGEIIEGSFLKNYSLCLSEDVVVGGRKYTNTAPPDDYQLHWKTGKTKEAKSAQLRSQRPYTSFMSNNFLIKKNIYLSIKMDESLEGYGHEDSKFGYDLQAKKIAISHIDNNILHGKLDSNVDFLLKTKEGIINFHKIAQEGYVKETKLYRSYSAIHKFNTSGLFIFLYNCFKSPIEKNLLSPNPSLFFLDLFKLKALLDISKDKV